MNLFTAKTVILANGAFPTHATPLAALRSARQVVCCDGAADRLVAAGLAPTWIVGDLDSLSAASRARFAERLVPVREQESNDLSKAFHFCRARGWTDLLILGATGLREDHTLGNLSLAADFAQEASALVLTDAGWFTPLLASARLPSFAGQQVSLFAPDPRTSVSAEGLRYPVEGLRLSRWWTAALNEATGDRVSLAFDGGPLLVFQTYGAAQ
jgi:thiamine pyrophosphokinase